MRVDVDKLLDQTVTIFNRVGAKDAQAKQDMYYPAVLNPAMWSEKIARSQDADGDVHKTKTVTVQVPSAAAAVYVGYSDFVSKVTQSDSKGFYTVSIHDYIVLDETGLTEALSKSEMVSALKSYSYAEVTAFRDCQNNSATDAAKNGCLKYLDMVQIEGV